MRISLAIAGMGLGGAQYVMAWLAGALAGRGHAVQLCTFAPPGQAPFFPVPPSVHMTPLDLTAPSGNPASAVRANLRRIRALRGAVFGFRSDVAVSFIDQMNVLCLLALSRRLPVVVSERITPARHHIGRLWSGLRRLTYPSARALVVQTADVASFFPPRVRRRCAMIPNPVLPPPPPNPAAPPAPRLPSPCVVGLGRLHPQKGFDLLLRAFARCRQAHPAWSLRIFGEGPQRPELEALAAELGLPAAEVFPGPVSDVPGILEQTDVFVLPSRFEGFPNALCQAMAQGVAVV
ncbi:MAG: glycosyltransferase, partial [Desulfovibrionaceae bacterium]